MGLLTATILTYLLSWVDPQTFNGIDAYDKPLKFQLSLATYLLTLGWMRRYLSPTGMQGRSVYFISEVPCAMAWLEMLYILWRASRGQASHFNISTALGSALYSLMGVGAGALLAGSAVLAVMLAHHPRERLDPAYLLAVRASLWMTVILGGFAGVFMSMHMSHWIGGVASDANGLPLLQWSRTGGDLREAHFLGIHAMQIVPMLAALITRDRNRPRAHRNVRLLCLIYAVTTVATFLQALAAVPPLIGF
ncbi:hypothetical protein D0B32_22865 [Paraburkholderia sp. DHOC27]|nr:hypothetical protein D0B32_22865 [Paraburkholderia sp. DHOC27]